MSAQIIRKETFAAIFLAALFMVSSSDAALELMGSYNITNIKDVFLEDLSGDKTFTVLVTSSEGIYALTDKAQVKWFYEAPYIDSVIVSDINRDGKKEIVLSTGLEVNKLEKGNLFILDSNGKVINRYVQETGQAHPNVMFNAMKATDPNGNGYKEIVGGNSVGVYELSDSYERIQWGYLINESVIGISVDDAASGSNDVTAYSYTELFALTPDGSLIRNYTVGEGIRKIISGGITGKSQQETLIISDEDNIYLLDKDYKKTVDTNLVGNIVEAEAFDLNGDGFREPVLGTRNGLYIVSSRFLIKAKYVTNDIVRGLYFSDWDGDGAKELVFGSGDYVYVLTVEGKIKDKLFVGKHIDRFVKGDLDNDGYTEVVTTSGKSVYILRNVGSKVSNDGRENYVLTESFMEMGKYDDARKSLAVAVKAYADAGDAVGVKACDVLGKEIDSRAITSKLQEADSLYKEAEAFLSKSDMDNARKTLDKASGIYSGINDSEGVSRCAALSAKIRVVPATNQNPLNVNISSVFRQSGDLGMFPLMSLFLIVAVVLLVVVLMIRKK